MIVFHKIRYRNFLSSGNQFNEVQLDKCSSTLITGTNGQGKSSILDALTFVLFGKPFRNISKNQLINSINGRSCEVEIEFTAGSTRYRVLRGIKPNTFDIHRDGELLNQDAATKDYQKVLEQQILKFNYKTFTQVVILGSATFVPFMQLPAAQRREVIEDILDIRVFSAMNTILKENVAATKEQLVLVEQDISEHKIKIQSQKKVLDVLENNRQALVESIDARIQTNNKDISLSTEEHGTLAARVLELNASQDLTEVETALGKVNKMKSKIAAEMEGCDHTKSFFNINTTCPTCKQDIAEHHKQVVIDDLESKIRDQQLKLDQLNKTCEKLNAKADKMRATFAQTQELAMQMNALASKVSVLVEQNNSLQKERDLLLVQDGDTAAEKSKLKSLAATAIDLVTRKGELLEQRQLHDAAAMLLKDSGIKTAIIKEYLPAINTLINRYLDAMDFYVKFELDESFQETIKSRGRDSFTYDSFSEGEKRRLDLSVLLTWRQIAKMKNSVNTNLLFLDEILDGSLDAVGIDCFLAMMQDLGGKTNVFVISHRDVADKFDRAIRIQKHNEFSVIVEDGVS